MESRLVEVLPVEGWKFPSCRLGQVLLTPMYSVLSTLLSVLFCLI